MELKIPYQDSYNKLKIYRAIAVVMLVIISILSITLPIIRQSGHPIYDLFDFVNIALIIGYFILNTVTEVFIYPSTSIKRRMGFIDNSIGSKLLDKPMTGYFSNDTIEFGSYKLAVNCYENCFFSYNIAKAMTLGIVIKNSVFAFSSWAVHILDSKEAL